MRSTRKVVIVGRGKVGRTLSRALHAAGVAVDLVSGRSRQIVGDVIVLTVPDAAIASVASRVAVHRNIVVHCAGRLDATPLAACAERGAHVGVLHPLVSFASARHPPSLSGATFVVRGDAAVVRAARSLARSLSMRVVVAPVHGPAYHAAAAMVAAGGAALVETAARVLVELGVSPRAAQRVLAGLLASVAENVATLGASRALTGPVARGDEATIAAHRRALGKDRDALRLYDAVTAAARALRR